MIIKRQLFRDRLKEDNQEILILMLAVNDLEICNREAQIILIIAGI